MLTVVKKLVISVVIITYIYDVTRCRERIVKEVQKMRVANVNEYCDCKETQAPVGSHGT